MVKVIVGSQFVQLVNRKVDQKVKKVAFKIGSPNV